MEVVILCGGFGTRLREETQFRPKPMVHIGERPILWHIMKYYASFGHTDFVLSLGYMGHLIKEYFWHYELMNNDITLQLGKPEQRTIHHSHDEAGWNITLADTGLEALKGARLKKVQRHVKGDTFMVTYGDGLANVDLQQLAKFHEEHGRLATVTGINPTSRFGELGIDGETVTSFREKPRAANSLVNGGYFVFNRGIFEHLSTDDSCDLEVGALEDLAQKGELRVFKHTDNWACMDTDRDRTYLNNLWTEGHAFWKRW
ncbi:MAG: glucose-1-phosphate cytidylyltransferase [Deltaproteobacteria bacterium]|nr:glucose-1-phosphate cytidylyltransferase [Deltaproteobacteria bacterium]